jgi:hypothetical protein
VQPGSSPQIHLVPVENTAAPLPVVPESITTQRIVEAEFDIDSWDEVPYDEPDEGPKMTRVVIRKSHGGALTGTGVAEVLTTQGSRRCRLICLGTIQATLDGRPGTS